MHIFVCMSCTAQGCVFSQMCTLYLLLAAVLAAILFQARGFALEQHVSILFELISLLVFVLPGTRLFGGLYRQFEYAKGHAGSRAGGCTIKEERQTGLHLP